MAERNRVDVFIEIAMKVMMRAHLCQGEITFEDCLDRSKADCEEVLDEHEITRGGEVEVPLEMENDIFKDILRKALEVAEGKP